MNLVLQRIATTCAATALALAAAPATTQLAGTLLGQRSGATLAFSGGSTLGASGSGSGVASGTVAFVPFSVNFSVTAIGGASLDGVTAQRLLPGWPVALTSAGGVETFATRVLTAPYSVALTRLVVDVSADGLAGVLVPILQPYFEGLLAAQLGSLAAPAFDGTMLATRNVSAVPEPGSAPLLALGLAALGLAGRRRLAGLARVRAVGRCACPIPRLPPRQRRHHAHPARCWPAYAYQNADSLFDIFNAAAAIHGSGDDMAVVAAVALQRFIGALGA